MCLRLELRAVRAAITELRDAIKQHAEEVRATQQTDNKENVSTKPIPVIVSYDEQTNTGQNSQNTTQKQIATWTKRAVYAACFYAAIAAWQGCEMRKATIAATASATTAQEQLVDGERPWVGFGQSEVITRQEFIPNQKTAHLTVEYKLLNYGHSPAYVFIHSHIKDIGNNKDRNWLGNTLNEECKIAKQTLKTNRPLTLLPNVPTSYTIVYDGADGQDTVGVEHMGEIDEQYGFNDHTATNVGCIAYQSTSDSAIRHTPFTAFFYFKDRKTLPEINGPYVIGEAN
jgi:hypothetical protein